MRQGVNLFNNNMAAIQHYIEGGGDQEAAAGDRPWILFPRSQYLSQVPPRPPCHHCHCHCHCHLAMTTTMTKARTKTNTKTKIKTELPRQLLEIDLGFSFLGRNICRRCHHVLLLLLHIIILIAIVILVTIAQSEIRYQPWTLRLPQS